MAGAKTRERTGRVALPWLLGGVLLHFGLPLYLLACVAACLLPPVASWGEVPGRMLWTGTWFVPALLAVTMVAVLAAALVEWRGGEAPMDQKAVSRARLAAAGRTLAALDDRGVTRALAGLDAIAWNHGDDRDRRVIGDLDAAARTFGAAAASAAPERRAAVLALAAESVERLATAGRALAAARGALDEGDARVVAGYLAARYDEGRPG